MSPCMMLREAISHMLSAKLFVMDEDESLWFLHLPSIWSGENSDTGAGAASASVCHVEIHKNAHVHRHKNGTFTNT